MNAYPTVIIHVIYMWSVLLVQESPVQSWATHQDRVGDTSNWNYGKFVTVQVKKTAVYTGYRNFDTNINQW